MTTKWTKLAIDSYKKTGDDLKALGFKAIREIQDRDSCSVLTFWAGLDGTMIQQTWTDTGAVVLYRQVSELELEGMKEASV